MVAKAYAQYNQSSGSPPNETLLAAAFATFEEARRIDPTNVSAWYLPSTYLIGLRRGDEAYPLAKKALELAPGSTSVHRAYWDAVTGSREIAAERKRQEIEQDVITFLNANGDRPSALLAVAGVSRDMKWTDRERECEEKILNSFPDSPEAEWVFARRWRGQEQTEDGTETAQYRQILRDFIARPHHQNEDLLGEAYRHLFFALSADESASAEELFQAAEGTVKHPNMNERIAYVNVPLTLADRKIHLADAEQIAREGIDVLKNVTESRRSMYRSQGEFERAIGWATATAHDALGWVLLAEDRPANAEKELLVAYDLNHEDRGNLNHLGPCYLARVGRSSKRPGGARSFSRNSAGGSRRSEGRMKFAVSGRPAWHAARFLRDADSKNSHSLVAQDLHGIDPGSAPRRKVACG